MARIHAANTAIITPSVLRPFFFRINSDSLPPPMMEFTIAMGAAMTIINPAKKENSPAPGWERLPKPSCTDPASATIPKANITQPNSTSPTRARPVFIADAAGSLLLFEDSVFAQYFPRNVALVIEVFKQRAGRSVDRGGADVERGLLELGFVRLDLDRLRQFFHDIRRHARRSDDKVRRVPRDIVAAFDQRGHVAVFSRQTRLTEGRDEIQITGRDLARGWRGGGDPT